MPIVAEQPTRDFSLAQRSHTERTAHAQVVIVERVCVELCRLGASIAGQLPRDANAVGGLQQARNARLWNAWHSTGW